MCGHEHQERETGEPGSGDQGRGHRYGHHRGPGFRGGFGRRGFPSHDEWLERLQRHEQRLEADLQNVRELIGLLGRPETPPPAQPQG
jgi:ribosomal protein L15